MRIQIGHHQAIGKKCIGVKNFLTFGKNLRRPKKV